MKVVQDPIGDLAFKVPRWDEGVPYHVDYDPGDNDIDMPSFHAVSSLINSDHPSHYCTMLGPGLRRYPPGGKNLPGKHPVSTTGYKHEPTWPDPPTFGNCTSYRSVMTISNRLQLHGPMSMADNTRWRLSSLDLKETNDGINHGSTTNESLRHRVDTTGRRLYAGNLPDKSCDDGETSMVLTSKVSTSWKMPICKTSFFPLLVAQIMVCSSLVQDRLGVVKVQDKKKLTSYQSSPMNWYTGSTVVGWRTNGIMNKVIDFMAYIPSLLSTVMTPTATRKVSLFGAIFHLMEEPG